MQELILWSNIKFMFKSYFEKIAGAVNLLIVYRNIICWDYYKNHDDNT